MTKSLEDFNSIYQKQIPSLPHSTGVLKTRINYYMDKIRTNEITDIIQIKKELNTYSTPYKNLTENIEAQSSNILDSVTRKRNNYLNEMKGNFVKSLKLSEYASPLTEEKKEQNIMAHQSPNQPISDKKPDTAPQFDSPLHKIPDIPNIHNSNIILRCPKCNQIIEKVELEKVLGIKIEEEAGNGREKCADCRKWIEKGEEYFFPCSHLIHKRCFPNVKKRNKCPTCGIFLGLKELPELKFQGRLETEEDKKSTESVKNLLEEIVNMKKEKELLIDLISDNNIHTISGTQIREIISYLVPTPNYHNTMEERKGTYSVYFYESSYLNKSGRHNQVALKVIPLPPINKEIKIQNLRLEFTSAFRCLLSPHIVRPISMCVNQNYVGILMEDGGMPIHELWRQVNWSTQYSFPAFLQLTKGLKHIHSQNIYHGDIKPDNILYDSISQTFKFTDFGAAVKFENTHKFNETVHTFGDIREATPPYMAPEIIWASSRKLNIEDFKFGKIDIFSLGATIYSLIQKDFIGGDLILMKDDPGKYQLFLETIGNNMSNTFAAMKGRNIQESTEYRIKNLILKCMALNPKDRCSCDEIIEELESILK